MNGGDREPGDFNWGETFKSTDPVELRRKQTAELKNGRLAMLAFSGMVTQATLTGHDAPFLYYTAPVAPDSAPADEDSAVFMTSPVATESAPEVFDYSSIAGGEAGLGGRYDFDPLNFAGRYPGMVPWFREAELKHGRICMLATIGMVVPSFMRVPGEQFQGSYLGWEAHDRLVASGALGQILLFVSLFETLAGIPAIAYTMNGGDREPGDFNWGETFKPTDPVELRRKQTAELKNGRLAMLAFSGMVTQATLTGHDTPFLYYTAPVAPESAPADEDSAVFMTSPVVAESAPEVFDYSSTAGGEAGLGGRYDFDPLNFAGRYPG